MNIHRINWLWGSTKAMEAAGVTELPKTWAEFNAACDKAVAAGKICLAHFDRRLDRRDHLRGRRLRPGHRSLPQGLRRGRRRRAAQPGHGQGLRAVAPDGRPSTWTRHRRPRLRHRRRHDRQRRGGVLHHGRLDDRPADRRRLQAKATDYVCAQAPTDWGKPGFILNSDSVVFFKQNDPDYIEGQKLLASLILSPEFQTVFNQAKGSIPARLDVDLSKGFNPCQQLVAEGPEGLDRGRHAGPLDGAQHDGAAEVPRRDDGHHHRVREHARHVARGRAPTPWPTRSKHRCRPADRPGAVSVRARPSSMAVGRARDVRSRPDPAGPGARPPPGASGWAPRCPILVLAPSLVASFVYVFVFTGWTFYISLSNSTLLPTYGFVGFENYVSLWANRRWNIAYTNLFFFSGFYVVGSMAVGLLLAILIDQRIRGEVGLAHDLPLSARGLLHRHRHGLELALQPDRRHPVPGARPRLDELQLRARPPTATTPSTPSSSPASGSPRASPWRCSSPACARSTRTSSRPRRSTAPATFRTYRKVILPTIAPIFLAVAVVLLQFAIKTFDLVVGADQRRPRHLDHLPGDLRLRPDVPARPDRRGRRGGDHDACRARRGAGALFALARLAPAQGGRPWLTPSLDPSLDVEAAAARPPAFLTRIVIYGLLASSRSIYLVPLLVVVLQLVPRPAEIARNGLIALPAQLPLRRLGPGLEHLLHRRHLRGHAAQLLQLAVDDDPGDDHLDRARRDQRLHPLEVALPGLGDRCSPACCSASSCRARSR